MSGYTQANLEMALRDIDPESFDNYKNKAKMSLPDIIKEMFIIGFYKHLREQCSLCQNGHAIVLRAYTEITTSCGSFKFDEE